MSVLFTLEATCGRARAGVLHTARGSVATPTFMPVGTRGTVKALTMEQVRSTGAEIVLGNAYHLGLHPGAGMIRELGGLHAFCGWKGPMLTDSGGYQVFSLASLNRVSDSGVCFRDPRSGRAVTLTPESSIRDQEAMGADIIMALDHCPPGHCSHSEAEEAMQRSLDWLDRCVRARSSADSSLFGIVQGASFLDLRRRSLEGAVAFDLPGYALGGFSVGEGTEAMEELLPQIAPLLPEDKPRYLMGVGRPEDLLGAIEAGMDMFDCVMPTRNARNGQLFSAQGRLRIRSSRFRSDFRPIEAGCSCLACSSGLSRAYLSHLCHHGEVLYLTLASHHNLTYYQSLMRWLRRAILTGKLPAVAAEIRQGWGRRSDR